MAELGRAGRCLQCGRCGWECWCDDRDDEGEDE